jgi:hypothetical protein
MHLVAKPQVTVHAPNSGAAQGAGKALAGPDGMTVSGEGNCPGRG